MGNDASLRKAVLFRVGFRVGFDCKCITVPDLSYSHFSKNQLVSLGVRVSGCKRESSLNFSVGIQLRSAVETIGTNIFK